MNGLFKYLTEEEYRILTSICKEINVKKGKVIIEERTKKKEFFYIVEGEVNVYTEKLGEEILITRLSKGNFIGEVAFFLKGLRTTSVRAETDLKLLKVDKEIFNQIEERYPKIAIKIYKALIENLSNKLAKTNLELETFNILYKATTE